MRRDCHWHSNPSDNHPGMAQPVGWLPPTDRQNGIITMNTQIQIRHKYNLTRSLRRVQPFTKAADPTKCLHYRYPTVVKFSLKIPNYHRDLEQPLVTNDTIHPSTPPTFNSVSQNFLGTKTPNSRVFMDSDTCNVFSRTFQMKYSPPPSNALYMIACWRAIITSKLPGCHDQKQHNIDISADNVIKRSRFAFLWNYLTAKFGCSRSNYRRESQKFWGHAILG